MLHCEDVDLSHLASLHGTPLYVYSKALILQRYQELRTAFGPDAHICYAVKANSNLHLLRLFAGLGVGFDLVSGGELRRLQAAGIDPSGAVFAGVAKEPWEIEAALRAGIAMFNLESPHELPLLSAAGEALGRTVPVAVRLNPDVDPRTHAYIATGKKENKFGLPLSRAGAVLDAIAADRHLDLVGVHVHLGSQVRRPEPYLEAFDRVAAFLDADPGRAPGLRHYDLGGGFGIPYGDGDPPLDVHALAEGLLPRLRDRGLRPVLEPGRYLVAESGLLLTTVLGTKQGEDRTFVLVDAAMNDLLRPALYGAEHPVVPVARPDAPPAGPCDLVGPVCETGDFLALSCPLPALARGDLLALRDAGAYGAVMASNYNSRRRPAEVLVDGAAARLVRRRDHFAELWAAELCDGDTI